MPKACRADGERARCEYILSHKKRQCNMTRRADEKYCAQHILQVKDTIGGRKRIPCPLDNGHTVWEDQLEHHMHKCRARVIVPQENWYREDCNVRGSFDDAAVHAKAIEAEDYEKWIPIVRDIYHKHVEKEPLLRDIKNHKGLQERLEQLENQKHAVQQASLIGHMDEVGLLELSNVIAEFGCGRGELSRYVSRARIEKCGIGDAGRRPQKFLLVDRASQRLKLDSKIIKDFEELKDNQCANNQEIPQVARVKVDIKDFVLGRAPLVEDEKQVSVISKHLCGCATDLTLTCLEHAHEEDNVRCTGMVIALCCRQVCNYDMYSAVGREWLAEAGGMDARGFRVLTRMTSWAVSGSREKEQNTSNHVTGLDPTEREQLGLMARRVIDYGRLLYLRQLGYKARIVEYIDKSVSLENHCLIATR